MIYSYLVVNSISYLIAGIACTIAPRFTARLIGLDPGKDQGLAEFTAMYGGMEVALGAFFLWSSLSAERYEVGILFALFSYAGLVAFRLFSMVTRGSKLGFGWFFFGFEAVMLGTSIFLFRI